MPDIIDERVTPVVDPWTGQGVPVSTSADPELEYALANLLSGTHTLPPYIDELERDFGNGLYGVSIYDQILYEPVVSSSVELLIDAALNREPDISPAVDPKEPDYRAALRISDACRYSLENMTLPFSPVLSEMVMGAFTHGHKVGEIVYRVGSVPHSGAPMLLHYSIKTKPQHTTGFVVDAANNEVGIVYNTPQAGRFVAGAGPSDMLPRSKFAVCRYRPRNGDPRGTSGLRDVYHAWWMLQQTYDSLKKYLALYGTPPIVGVLPEGVQPDTITDPITGLPIPGGVTPAKRLASKLVLLRGSGVLAVQFGTQVFLLEPRGTGDVYNHVITGQERRIVQGILFASRATMESQHGSRADSGTAQDVVGTRVRKIKLMTADFIRYEILRPFVELNFGTRFLSLLPNVSMGNIEQQDLATMLNAYATAYDKQFIRDDQLPDIHSQLNFVPSISLRSDIEAQRTGNGTTPTGAPGGRPTPNNVRNGNGTGPTPISDAGNVRGNTVPAPSGAGKSA